MADIDNRRYENETFAGKADGRRSDWSSALWRRHSPAGGLFEGRVGRQPQNLQGGSQP